MVGAGDLEVRTLRASELPEVHAALLDAFAVYPVRVQPTLAELRAMLVRRGADWSASVGAYHGGVLIGAVMIALDPPELASPSEPKAYVVIAGVRRSWQGRGALAAMFEWLDLALGRRGVRHLGLEVLADNPSARQAYARLGFTPERHLFCYELPPLARSQRFREELSFELYQGEGLGELELRHPPEWSSFWSLRPAWTNSDATVRRSRSRAVFEARWSDELVAYAIVDLNTNELLQLAVAPDHRRKGIATELLRACQEHADRPTLRVLNVPDDGDHGAMIAFLRQLGGKLFAVQLELLR
jgi:GNAT superfamily N-acetyltransferase